MEHPARRRGAMYVPDPDRASGANNFFWQARACGKENFFCGKRSLGAVETAEKICAAVEKIVIRYPLLVIRGVKYSVPMAIND